MYAPVTGYDTIFSQAQAPNYATGVERAENDLLTGTGSQLAFRNFIDTLTNKPQKGATVQVTINSKAQQAAYQQLQQTLQGKTINGRQQVGGVVALNPSTGAILAMASYPSYDPNQLAVHDTTKLNKVDSQLNAQNPSPLLNNATQTTLPPGSTFKIVTSSAWYTQDPTRNPNTGSTPRSRSSCPTGTCSTTTTTSSAVTGRARRRSSRVRPVLQHPVRQPRHPARRPRRSSRWPRTTASTTRRALSIPGVYGGGV